MGSEASSRPWMEVEPGQLIGRGHPAGDFLEAWKWKIVEERDRGLRLDVHLPPQVRNPRGQLFGGFTPTYVDLVALFTVRAGEPRSGWRGWLATTNMRVDYFEPVEGPRFVIDSRLAHRRRRMSFVETRFLSTEGELLVFALTTMRAIATEKSLGDA